MLFLLTSHQAHYPQCHFQLALEWKVKSRPCKGEVILFLFRWFCLPHGVTLANPFIQPDKNLPVFHERPLCECHTEFAQWNREDQPEKCRTKGWSSVGSQPQIGFAFLLLKGAFFPCSLWFCCPVCIVLNTPRAQLGPGVHPVSTACEISLTPLLPH